MYGDSADVHDQISGIVGSFKQTVNGIDNLVKLGAGVSVKLIINELNYRHLFDTINFLSDNKINSIRIHVLEPYDIGLMKNYFPLILKQLCRYYDDGVDDLDIKFSFTFFPCITERNDPVKIMNKEFMDKEFEITKLAKCQYCEYADICKGNFSFFNVSLEDI
jgi:hypothetical protein